MPFAVSSPTRNRVGLRLRAESWRGGSRSQVDEPRNATSLFELAISPQTWRCSDTIDSIYTLLTALTSL